MKIALRGVVKFIDYIATTKLKLSMWPYEDLYRHNYATISSGGPAKKVRF